MKKTTLPALLVVLLFATGCDKDDDHYHPGQPGKPQVENQEFTVSGDEAALMPVIDQFRRILGEPLNTTPDQQEGRREVNWDGVPANLSNNNSFPLDFFNLTDPAGANGRKRGLVYAQTGSPIRVDSSSFVDIDPSYASQFVAFSKKKQLIATTSTTSEVVFKVPGTNTDAFVHGFGIVFSDVDIANATTLEFYNGNKSLGIFKALPRNDKGPFSFLGVHFPKEKITRIKITAGNGILGAGIKDISDGGPKDLVAYDDFFYDEPKQNR